MLVLATFVGWVEGRMEHLLQGFLKRCAVSCTLGSMERSEEDPHFARYCETGDPESMARVFDLTAPKLLLAAAHLVKDASAAQDLVQSTFLSAIEKAEHYDPERPLLPWLMGILANRVRYLRRQESRSLRGVPAGREPADPATQIADEELMQRVSSAMDGLPVLYRPVLTLRLVHGLEPTMIAHTLGRPPATVRAQLRRGLQLLRNSLPVELLAPSTLALLSASASASASGGTMAAVRASVLKKAASATLVPSTVSTFAVVWIMKKLAISVAVVLLLSTFWFTWNPAEQDAGVDGSVPARLVADPSGKQDKRVTENGAEARTQIQQPTGEELLVIRGRVLAFETDEPVPQCKVSLKGRKRVRKDPIDPSWADPDPVRTNAAGEFEIIVDLPRSYRLSVYVESEGRIRKHRSFPDPWKAGAGILDAGTVRLRRGVRLRGRVVDERGQMISGARVSLSPRGGQPRRDPVWRQSSPSRQEAGSDGRFEFKRLVPLGSWAVELSKSPALVRPTTIDLRSSDGATKEIEILVEYVRPEDTITGVVTDGSGAPLRSVRIRAEASSAGSGSHHTAADGRFRIFRSRRDRVEGVRLRIPATDRWSEFQSPEPIPWGTREHRVVLRATPGLWIQAVHGVTGDPIEEFSIKLRSKKRKSSGGRHENGLLLIPSVKDGPNIVVVFPEESELLPSMPVAFRSPRRSKEPLCIELYPASTFEVDVRFRDDSPAPGSRVWLLYSKGTTFTEHPARISEIHSFGDYMSGGQPSMRLAHGETDARGTAKIRWFPSPNPLTLYVRGELHALRVVEGVVLRAGQRIRVTVDGGARIHGRLFPAERLTQLLGSMSEENETVPDHAPAYYAASRKLGLVLGEIDGNRQVPATHMDCAGITKDGTFDIRGIPAGHWGLFMKSSIEGSIAYKRAAALAVFKIGHDETRRLDIDLRNHFEPVRIAGRVLHNGKPLANTELYVSCGWRSPGKRFDYSTRLKGRTDEAGRFDFAELRPMDHAIYVRLGRDDPLIQYPVMKWRTLASGSRVDEEFHIRTVRARFRLVLADGKTPVAGRRVLVRSELEGVEYAVTSDQDGRLNLEFAPRRLTLYVWPGLRKPRVPIGTFTRSGDEEETTVKLPPDMR